MNRATATSAAPLSTALIGTGKISEEHLKYLTASPRARVVGVCDLSPSLAKYAADRFNAGRPFSDYERMLAETRPDVVHVLTPPHTHVRIVGDCLRAGAHVIVEKPVAPTNGEFRSLWDLAQANGRRIIEDHNYRFNKPILAIERLLRDGTLGEVREVDVRMALAIRKTGNRYADPYLRHPSHDLPAGVIHEFLTHLCYLALRFLPDDASRAGQSESGRQDPAPSPARGASSERRVAAAWSKHGSEPMFRFDDLDALVIERLVHARIRFTSHAGPDTFAVTVRGTKGWAETDLFQPYLRVVAPRPGGPQLSPLANHLVNGANLMKSAVVGFSNKVFQKTPYEGLRTFLSRTYKALGAGAEPPVTFADMDRASRLVDALLDERNRV